MPTRRIGYETVTPARATAGSRMAGLTSYGVADFFRIAAANRAALGVNTSALAGRPCVAYAQRD